MANKFIDQNGLRYFFSKLKRMFEKKADKSDLKPVATSGKYSDLEGKPEIDKTVTEGSENAVSGGAVYTAISNLPSDNNTLLVNITGADDENLSADKTYEEIDAAVQKGEAVMINVGGDIFQFAFRSDIMIVFSSNMGITAEFLSCTKDNVWTLSEVNYATDNDIQKIKPIYVNITVNDDNQTIADKAFQELVNDYKTNKNLYVNYSNGIVIAPLTLVARNDNGEIENMFFSTVQSNYQMSFRCNANQGWIIDCGDLASADQIYNLTKIVEDLIVFIDVTEDDNGNLSADKTFADLVSDIKSGARVIARYNDIDIPYVGASKISSSTSDGGTSTETFSILYFQCELSNQSYMLTCEESGWQKVYLNFLHEQVDQEQNDSTQLDYIKNRTHWKEVIQADEVVLFPETEIDMSEDGVYTQAAVMDVQIGDEINVSFNGELYTLSVYSMIIEDESEVCLCLGNVDSGLMPEYETYPFGIIFNRRPGATSWEDGATIVFTDSDTPAKIKIYTGGSKPIYHKLDTKYLNTTSKISPETVSDKEVVTSRGVYQLYLESQPDWEADSGEKGYIRNRPMSKIIQNTKGYGAEETITFTNGICQLNNADITIPYINDYEILQNTVTMQWNGTEYTCYVRDVYIEYTDKEGVIRTRVVSVFGNVSEVDSHYEDTAPFLVYILWNPETNEEILGIYIKSVNDTDKETSTATVKISYSYDYYCYMELDNRYLHIDKSVMQNSSNMVSGSAVYEYIESAKSEIAVKRSNEITAHNTNTEAHNDMRLLIKDLTDRLNALADSDDTTLDQMSEIVAYIKNNKSLIDNITTTKSNVADIINNLATNVADKPLSAAQGVALKALIDAITVPTNLSQLSDDSTHRLVTDSEKNTWNSKLDLTATNNAIKTFFGGKTVVFSTTAPAEGTSDDVITFVKRSG